eukprot:scaffold1753_cov90-Phaeocystis_antarctica.AAC.3
MLPTVSARSSSTTVLPFPPELGRTSAYRVPLRTETLVSMSGMSRGAPPELPVGTITRLRKPQQTEYVFGQNMTEHNPAPSPSGHPLLSGPPTLSDIHQIFTVSIKPVRAPSKEAAATSPRRREEDGACVLRRVPLVVARLHASHPRFGASRMPADRRDWVRQERRIHQIELFRPTARHQALACRLPEMSAKLAADPHLNRLAPFLHRKARLLRLRPLSCHRQWIALPAAHPTCQPFLNREARLLRLGCHCQWIAALVASPPVAWRACPESLHS